MYKSARREGGGGRTNNFALVTYSNVNTILITIISEIHIHRNSKSNVYLNSSA